MTDRYLNWDKLNKINNKIDWKSNVGFTLLFFINNEKHSLKIIEDCGYKGRSHYIKVEFDNNVIKELRTGRLQSMEFKKLYYKYTFKYKPGEIINGLCIIDQIAKKTKISNWVEKRYKCSCVKDGYEFEVSEYSLCKRHSGCPVCSNKKIIAGINDIATTDPWMVVYFKNKSESQKYSSCSGHEITCKCPICGKEKEMTIEVLHRYGFRCDFCSDKISYPNKLMTYALLQLQNENIITNFQRKFSAPWSGSYKYDGYFEFNSQAFIIEMDGGFHFNDNTFNNQTYQRAQQIDLKKQRLAESNNIIVLRVNCNYKIMKERDSYLVENLKETLSKYIDTSVINWSECTSKASNNLIHEICSKYNSGLSRKALRNQYPWITNTTIGNYLKIGTQCGLCNYDGTYTKQYSQFYFADGNKNILEHANTAKHLIDIIFQKYSLKLPNSTLYKIVNTDKCFSKNYFIMADLICQQEV